LLNTQYNKPQDLLDAARGKQEMTKDSRVEEDSRKITDGFKKSSASVQHSEANFWARDPGQRSQAGKGKPIPILRKRASPPRFSLFSTLLRPI
jgi:hypothetical protein